MKGDLSPEEVLSRLKKGQGALFYLFYGPDEFRLEHVLNKMRQDFMPDSARDFNLAIFYGDDEKFSPGHVIDAARSLPFMAENRLIIVRRTEKISSSELEAFIPYLENPVSSTCLIFISSKTDFTKKFYRTLRTHRATVHFGEMKEYQIVGWIRQVAGDLGIDMDREASAYLKQIVGDRLIELHSELEKLSLRYGGTPVGVREVETLAVHSRTYTIFELMDRISSQQSKEAVKILEKYLDEEGRDGGLGILGMLNRQMRILWQAKSVLDEGGNTADVARRIKLPPFLARKTAAHSKKWSSFGLEKAFHLLYEADGLLKTGADKYPVLENLVLCLCSL